VRGFLGPWTKEELHRYVMNEGKYYCHSITNNIAEGEAHFDQDYCVGAIEFMNKNGKICRDPIIQKMQTLHDQVDKDVMTVPEFHDHHDMKLIKMGLKK
jgi:hypothetical protein